MSVFQNEKLPFTQAFDNIVREIERLTGAEARKLSDSEGLKKQEQIAV